MAMQVAMVYVSGNPLLFHISMYFVKNPILYSATLWVLHDLDRCDTIVFDSESVHHLIRALVISVLFKLVPHIKANLLLCSPISNNKWKEFIPQIYDLSKWLNITTLYDKKIWQNYSISGKYAAWCSWVVSTRWVSFLCVVSPYSANSKVPVLPG